MGAIDSLYGYYYQKELFFNKFMHLRSGESVDYELLDDVSLEKEELNELNGKIESEKKIVLIQAKKSKTLNKKDKNKTIANWLIAYKKNKEKDHEFILHSEYKHNLDNISFEDFSKYSDSSKEKTSLAYKVKNIYENNLDELETDFNYIKGNFKNITKTFTDLEADSKNKYIEDYCEDFNLDTIKKDRYDIIVSCFEKKFKEALKDKKPCTLKFKQKTTFHTNAVEKINSENYKPDYKSFKDENMHKVNNEIKNNTLREVKILSKFLNKKNLVDAILHQKLYLALKENFIYETFSNEQIMAEDNYYSVKNDIKPNNQNELYTKVLEKIINITYCENPLKEYFSNGCYVFLTSEDGGEIIDWKL